MKNSNQKHYNKRKGGNRRTSKPSQFALFTVGKTPELAIFYNLALDRLSDFVKFLEGRDIVFKDEDFELSTEENYLKLKEYLWKGVSTFVKNDQGSFLSEEDKEIISLMVKKLIEIRNFHSHYWHDNSVLQFSDPLVNFIENQYEIALKETSRLEGVSGDLFYAEGESKYKPFQKHDGNFFITQEGRLFFLSFFLNKGDMDALLQQTKGSKGNYLPEHRFKRKAYTYFCHREGATWFNSTLPKENQDLVSEEEQKSTYFSKHGLRILNYLNDYPLYFMNSDFMSLWFKNEDEFTEVKGIKNLLLFIEQKTLFPSLNFKEKDYSKQKSQVESSSPSEKELKELKEIEDKERIGSIEMRFVDNKDYYFEISYPTLYQITLECYLDKERVNIFKKILKSLIERRKYLFDLLTSDDADRKGYFETIEREYFYPRLSPKEIVENEAKELGKSDEEIEKILNSLNKEFYSLEELANFPMGSNAKVLDKLEKWKKAVEKGKSDEKDSRLRAVNLFRPNSIPFINERGMYRKKPENEAPQPILVHLAEFYKGFDQKPRTRNKFLRWAGQYLMDFELCSDWEFAYEEYLTEQKFDKNKNEEKTKVRKKISYGKVIPKDHRIKLMKNHLLFRVAKSKEPADPKDYYYFMLGKKAMVYILNWILIEKKDTDKESLNELTSILKEDLNSVESMGEGALKDLKLYEYREKSQDNKFSSTLPEFKLAVKKRKVYSREQLIHKIQTKLKSLEFLIENADKYNRNDLNNHLLKTYQLFDFGQTTGGKFLRKNEYQLMSVVHYMLNQKSIRAKDYLDKRFEPNGSILKKRIPGEIYNFIISSESLKDLFLSVTSDRIVNLQLAYDELTVGNSNIEEIAKKCHFLTKYTQKGNPEKTKKSQKDSYPFLPLYINPNLIIKYFDSENYKNGKYVASLTDSEKKYINIYEKIRKNLPLTNVLNSKFYEEFWDEKMISTVEDLPEETAHHLRKLKYWFNRYRLHAYTEDILLYSMALEYMKIYNSDLTDELRKFKVSQQTKLQGLFKVPIVKELLNNKDKTGIFISYRLHQTDDYFFRLEQNNFLDLAKHYLLRRKWEIAYYESKGDAVYTEKYKNLPDGTETTPIPIGLLLQERKIILQSNMEITTYLFEMEKEWISNVGDSINDSDKQKELIELFKASSSGTHPYIPFGMLSQKFQNENSKDLNDLRNNVFHNKIPDKPYIPFMGAEKRENKLFDILKINDRIGKDKTLPSGYEQEK